MTRIPMTRWLGSKILHSLSKIYASKNDFNNSGSSFSQHCALNTDLRSQALGFKVFIWNHLLTSLSWMTQEIEIKTDEVGRRPDQSKWSYHQFHIQNIPQPRVLNEITDFKSLIPHPEQYFMVLWALNIKRWWSAFAPNPGAGSRVNVCLRCLWSVSFTSMVQGLQSRVSGLGFRV